MVGKTGATGSRGPTGETGPRGPSSRRGLIGYLILVAAIAVAFGLQWKQDREVEQNRRERVQQINQINTFQCRSLQNLYLVIRKSLRDSDKAIDELSYYKQFPLERTEAHRRNAETLELFRVPPCPSNFTVDNE